MAVSQKIGATPEVPVTHLHDELLEHFSVEELEVLTSNEVVEYASKDTNSFKPLGRTLANLASKLAVTFEQGDEHTARDLRKAHRLKKLALSKPRQNETKSEKAARLKEEARLENEWTGTKKVYWLMSTYGITRLAVVRTNRIFIALGLGAFLPIGFAVLSTSFWLELAFEFSVLFKSIFLDKPSDQEKQLSQWQRFKKLFLKDKRPYRMINAAIWAPINTACLFLSFAFFALSNAIGFGLDAIHELFWLYRVYKRYNTIEEKLNTLLEKQAGNPYKKEVLEHLLEATKQKRKWDLISQGYQTAIISLVFVGMLLIFFGSFPGAFLVGSGIALFIGSIVGGIGKRVWTDYVWPTIKKYNKGLNDYFAMEFKQPHPLNIRNEASILAPDNYYSKEPKAEIPMGAKDNISADTKPGQIKNNSANQFNMPAHSSTQNLSQTHQRPSTTMLFDNLVRRRYPTFETLKQAKQFWSEELNFKPKKFSGTRPLTPTGRQFTPAFEAPEPVTKNWIEEDKEKNPSNKSPPRRRHTDSSGQLQPTNLLFQPLLHSPRLDAHSLRRAQGKDQRP